MDDFTCDPIAAHCGDSYTSSWPTREEQAQTSSPPNQDQTDHLTTTSQDEYARWILMTPQEKVQRKAKTNGTKRSTPPFAATMVNLDDDGIDMDDGDVDGLQGWNHSSHSSSNDSNDILKPTKPPEIEPPYASRSLQKNLQMFDPLNSDSSSKYDKGAMPEQQQQQPRRRHTSVGGATVGNSRLASRKPAAAPTLLPTSKSSCVMSSLPARPRSKKHLPPLDDGTNQERQKQRDQQQQCAISNWLDLDSHESTVIPITPSKQASQLPGSMISSFVEKSSKGGGSRDPVDFKGKANRQLVDFDPFLSQDPLERKDAFKCIKRDGMSGPTAAPRPKIDTRFPLPTSKKSSSTLSSEEDEEEPTPTHYQQVPSSTTAPLSCNSKQHETYYGDRIFRRPSLLTNDLIQEQRDKERHLSRCLDVDLVSVQGELCVPESISSHSDAEQPLQQHSSISSSVSSTTSPISQPPLQRQVSSLHERLQELVNDEPTGNEVTHSNHSSFADNDAWSAEDYPPPPPPPVVVPATGPPKRRTRPSFNTKRTIPVAATTPASLPSPTLSPTPHHPAMSPSASYKLYHLQLSPFEQQEIMNYAQIFFVGSQAKNKHQATMDQLDHNYGYDDDRGDYLLVPKDHLAYRYEIMDTLGKGSFGQVVKALDHKTGITVAVKLIRNKKRFHAQALVEVKTLEDLMKWDPEDKHNNVRMTDHFYFRNHLCIVFECLSINLYDFIKNNHFQGSSMGLIRRFTIQLLNSLILLHQHHLIHCDLKPENILLKHPTKSTIKVIDFGSSCLENEKVYTYIQSRFYRAPEVILGLEYSTAIDMWSMGCILVELYTGYPLFPGENEQDQLACVMEVCGVPDRGLVEKSPRRKGFFDLYGNPKIMPNSKGKKRKPGTRSLPSILKCSDDKFVDFIHQCLQWDPDERITPDEAFKHGWIARLPL